MSASKDDDRNDLNRPEHEAVLEPETWGTWGGAIDEGLSPEETVVREAGQEAGIPIDKDNLISLVVFGSAGHGFRYHDVLAVIENEMEPLIGWETSDFAWRDFWDWTQPLHFGARFLLSDAFSLRTVQEEISRRQKKAFPII